MLLVNAASPGAGQAELFASVAASLASRSTKGAGTFTYVHDVLLESELVPRCAVAVYLALAKFTNQATKETFCRVATLAKAAKYSRRSVIYALRLLERLLLLETRQRGANTKRRTNLYRLTDPKAAFEALREQAEQAAAAAAVPEVPSLEPLPSPPKPPAREPEFEFDPEFGFFPPSQAERVAYQEALAFEADPEASGSGFFLPSLDPEDDDGQAFEPGFFLEPDDSEQDDPSSIPQVRDPERSFFNSSIPCNGCTDDALTLYSYNQTPHGSLKTPNPRPSPGASANHLPPKVVHEAAEQLAGAWQDAGLQHSPRDNQGYASKKALRALSRALRAGHSLESLKAAVARYRQRLKTGANGLRFARAFANFWSSKDYLAHLPAEPREPTPEDFEVRQILHDAFGWMGKDKPILDDVFVLLEDGERFIEALDEHSRHKLHRWIDLCPYAVARLPGYRWKHPDAERYRLVYPDKVREPELI